MDLNPVQDVGGWRAVEARRCRTHHFRRSPSSSASLNMLFDQRAIGLPLCQYDAKHHPPSHPSALGRAARPHLHQPVNEPEGEHFQPLPSHSKIPSETSDNNLTLKEGQQLTLGTHWFVERWSIHFPSLVPHLCPSPGLSWSVSYCTQFQISQTLPRAF